MEDGIERWGFFCRDLVSHQIELRKKISCRTAKLSRYCRFFDFVVGWRCFELEQKMPQWKDEDATQQAMRRLKLLWSTPASP